MRILVPTFFHLDSDTGWGEQKKQVKFKKKIVIKVYFKSFLTCVFGDYFIFPGSFFRDFWIENNYKEETSYWYRYLYLYFCKPSGTGPDPKHWPKLFSFLCNCNLIQSAAPAQQMCWLLLSVCKLNPLIWSLSGKCFAQCKCTLAFNQKHFIALNHRTVWISSIGSKILCHCWWRSASGQYKGGDSTNISFC